MNPDLLKKVIDTLEWAMLYAAHGHELMYPGEWYEEDGYVAQSVINARAVLAELKSLDPRAGT